jgi:hypothetical protein
MPDKPAIIEDAILQLSGYPTYTFKMIRELSEQCSASRPTHPT